MLGFNIGDGWCWIETHSALTTTCAAWLLKESSGDVEELGRVDIHDDDDDDDAIGKGPFTRGAAGRTDLIQAHTNTQARVFCARLGWLHLAGVPTARHEALSGPSSN
eukprot:5642267-Amphidinium_carterae.1